MIRKLKSLICVLMVLSMLSLSVAIPVAADEADGLPMVTSEDLVSKNAEYDADTASYTVSLTIPGQDSEQIHDEVVIMVDASFSGDRYWNDMKNAIDSIGKAVLNGKGNTQLTLMSFAMCGHTVLSHIKSVEELQLALSGSEPGSLLYGLSSTNCEVGFTWVDAYLKAHDDTLNKAEVIYISDGSANTHEAPWAYDKWKERTWTNFSNLVITTATVSMELEAVENGANPSNSLVEIFGEKYDLSNAEDLEEISMNASYEEKEALIDAVYAEVYAAAGLTLGEAYPVSVVERAFVGYDMANGTYVQYYFYYTAFGRSFGGAGARAADAAEALLKNEKLAALHMVDTNGVDTWIQNIDNASGKVSITKSNGIAGLLDAIEDVLTNLARLPFHDVVVTDYMSKWVSFDRTSISIVDDTTGKEIWNSESGWLITENRPTHQDAPVIVELVEASDYALGGPNVIGNRSGEIYKITWYVKDGELRRSDHYHLEYVVALDTGEPGFQYDQNYPANGITTVEYLDEYGVPQEDEIIVPEVVEVAPAEYTVTAKKHLTGRDPVAGEFSFTMTEAGADGTIREGAECYTAKNAADGSVTFPTIKNLFPGDYYYVISEDIPDETWGVTYDKTEYLVHLQVVYDSGEYLVIPHLDGAGDITFTNTYAITEGTSVTFSGNKALDGRELVDGEFTFALYRTDSSFDIRGRTPETTVNAGGRYTFQLDYGPEDVGKTFFYVVQEANAGKTVDGITYSNTSYHLTIRVLDNGKGGLYVENLGQVPMDRLDFTNIYQEVTAPGEPLGPPETGDNLLVYIAVECLALAGIAVVLASRKKAVRSCP